MRDEYRKGDYNVICDFSGFKIKRSQAKKMWNGLMVDEKYWERRHPQDFIRARKDRQAVPDPRPEDENSFLTTNQVTRDDL